MTRWWQKLRGAHPDASAGDYPLQERLVVVDTETTGLNPRRDALLSIGAVAVSGGRLDLHDSFYRLLQCEFLPSGENVLVHRLTPSQLQQAAEPRQALQAFRDYVQDCPLFAYHADFDRSVLNRALKKSGLPALGQPFIDVAHWVLLAEPGLGSRPPTLDAASAYFRIQHQQRHDAHSDALTTALLVMKLLKHPETPEATTVSTLSEALRHHQQLRNWRH